MSDADRPLARLVKARQERGISYRQMERRARDAGYTMTHAQFADYGADQVAKMPSQLQMEAIAAGIAEDYAKVQAACFEQWYGYVPTGVAESPGVRLGAMLPPDMTADEEAELRRLLRSWLEAKRGS